MTPSFAHAAETDGAPAMPEMMPLPLRHYFARQRRRDSFSDAETLFSNASCPTYATAPMPRLLYSQTRAERSPRHVEIPSIFSLYGASQPARAIRPRAPARLFRPRRRRLSTRRWRELFVAAALRTASYIVLRSARRHVAARRRVTADQIMHVERFLSTTMMLTPHLPRRRPRPCQNRLPRRNSHEAHKHNRYQQVIPRLTARPLPWLNAGFVSSFVSLPSSITPASGPPAAVATPKNASCFRHTPRGRYFSLQPCPRCLFDIDIFACCPPRPPLILFLRCYQICYYATIPGERTAAADATPLLRDAKDAARRRDAIREPYALAIDASTMPMIAARY